MPVRRTSRGCRSAKHVDWYRFRWMRRPLAIALVPLLVLAGGSARPVRADDGTAADAARQIADARDRANAAADAVFAAESQLDQLRVRQQATQRQVDDLQAQVDLLRAAVQHVALQRLTRSGSDPVPLLTGFVEAGDLAQTGVLIDVINDTSAEDFDRFAQLDDQLRDKRAALDQQGKQIEGATTVWKAKQQQATDEVQRLKVVEADRLKSEAVAAALRADQADRARKAAADAAARARDQAAKDAADAAARRGALAGGDGGSGGGSDGSDGSGIAGGQTGGGGSGGQPGGNATDYGSADWLCPVQGSTAFGDTWGAPRSGGRRHQGVDMISSIGTPVVAVVDGVATPGTNELGGNTVSLVGADGNRYYYAHLDHWNTTGQVTRGTVIAYVGQTGNAILSVPHLHFEIHPGGGAAVNPYPTVRAHC